MERAPRHSTASTLVRAARQRPFTGASGEVCSGVEGSGGNEQRSRCSEDRQTRSDCHSAVQWSRNRASSVHGCQGTVLKRLAVTKRMKGGEFHSFFTAKTVARAEKEDGLQRSGREDAGSQLGGRGQLGGGVGPACMPRGRWCRTRAVEA